MYLQLQVFFFKEPARVSYVFEQLFGDTKDHGFTDIDVTVSESHLQSVHRILKLMFVLGLFRPHGKALTDRWSFSDVTTCG